MSDDLDETKAALKFALHKFQEAKAVRSEAEENIERWKRIAINLAELCGEEDILVDILEPPDNLGITDRCRDVLRQNSQQVLTAVEVRDAIVASGYDLSKYSNPVAMIHVILNRLYDSGETERLVKNDKKAYRWNFVDSGSRRYDRYSRPDRFDRFGNRY